MRCLNCEHADLPPGTQWCPGCESYLPAQVRDCLPSGTLLDHGKYRIEHVLGRGGFGITYLGHQVRLKRLLAIKEFFPREHVVRSDSGARVAVPSDRRSAVESARRRFLREAEHLVRLCDACGHDLRGVVHVLDFFEDERTETAYTVMEYVVGDRLRRELQAEMPLEGERIRHVVGALVEALERVHGGGLMHLDLKPENVLVTAAGRVVLIDFGATARAGLGTRSSREYTEDYAPPEVAAKREVGPYSDVFELGMMLAEMALGRRVASAAQRMAVLSMGEADPLDLGAVGPPWRALCEGALRIRPAERPTSVREWWAAAAVQVSVTAEPRRPVDLLVELSRRARAWRDDVRGARLIERPIGVGDLLARLPEVLTEIEQARVVYRVSIRERGSQPRSEFVMGPATVFLDASCLGNEHLRTIVGPQLIDADKVTKWTDLVPSPLGGSPFLHRNGRVVAISVRVDQYQRLVAAQGLAIETASASAPGTVRVVTANPINGGAPVEFTFVRVPADGLADGAKVPVAAFELMVTPVTREQWAAVMGSCPSRSDDANVPVVNVSWLDAVAFCNDLSAALGLAKAYRVVEPLDPRAPPYIREEGSDVANAVWDLESPGFRLPTEDEWEHACLAGGAGSTGESGAASLYAALSGPDYLPVPVGQNEPNAFGLCDMLGNVCEWCWDATVHKGLLFQAPRVTGPLAPVMRGGRWCQDPSGRRPGRRDRGHPDAGLRLARSIR